MLCSLKIHMLWSNQRADGWKGGAFRKWLCNYIRSLLNEISALKNRPIRKCGIGNYMKIFDNVTISKYEWLPKKKNPAELILSFCHVRKQEVDHLSTKKLFLVLSFLTSWTLSFWGKSRPFISYLHCSILFTGIQIYKNIKGRIT
jgi:hypothetical protein